MASNKYIAFLDVLGFKDLIENNKIEELEKLYTKLEGSVLFSFAVTNPQHTLKNNNKSLPTISETNLNSLVISDSIIIWTDDDSQGSFLELILAVRFFMNFSMKSGFPIRGGISCGELLIKHGKHDASPKFNSFTTLLGLSLTRAYILESKSEWSGCIIDEKCVEHFESVIARREKTDVADLKFFESMAIIKSLKPPLKSGKVKDYYVINWTHDNVQMLKSEQIRNSFSAHNKNIDDWSVESKIKNTLQFLEDAKPDFERLTAALDKK